TCANPHESSAGNRTHVSTQGKRKPYPREKCFFAERTQKSFKTKKTVPRRTQENPARWVTPGHPRVIFPKITTHSPCPTKPKRPVHHLGSFCPELPRCPSPSRELHGRQIPFMNERTQQ